MPTPRVAPHHASEEAESVAWFMIWMLLIATFAAVLALLSKVVT